MNVTKRGERPISVGGTGYPKSRKWCQAKEGSSLSRKYCRKSGPLGDKSSKLPVLPQLPCRRFRRELNERLSMVGTKGFSSNVVPPESDTSTCGGACW